MEVVLDTNKQTNEDQKNDKSHDLGNSNITPLNPIMSESENISKHEDEAKVDKIEVIEPFNALERSNTLIIEKPKKIEGFIDINTSPRKPGYIELESSSPNSRYKNTSRLENSNINTISNPKSILRMHTTKKSTKILAFQD